MVKRLSAQNQNNLPLTNVVLPTNFGDAASKGYVDNSTTFISAKNYSLVSDVKEIKADGYMPISSAVLSTSVDAFVAGDVGKTIVISGAGAAGIPLVTTIQSFTNTKRVTLSTNSSAAMDGVDFFFGTDNASALSNAIAALTTSSTLKIPKGNFLTTSLPSITSYTNWEGDGQYSTKIYIAKASGSGLSGVDLNYVSIKKLSLIGGGRASGTTNGIDFTISSQTANNYLTLEDLFVSNFGQDGISINTPIVSKFNRVVVFQSGRYGINLFGTGESAGTSVSLDNCFTAGNYGAGYRFKQMAYSTLDACASDANGVGYIYDTCTGITENGSGTEETYNFYLLGKSPLTVNGISRYVFNSKMVFNSPYMIQNVGTSFYVTNNAKITINQLYEGSPGNGDDPNSNPTESLKVDASCSVILNGYVVSTPMSLANDTTVINVSGTPTLDNQLANKSYVDSHSYEYVFESTRLESDTVVYNDVEVQAAFNAKSARLSGVIRLQNQINLPVNGYNVTFDNCTIITHVTGSSNAFRQVGSSADVNTRSVTGATLGSKTITLSSVIDLSVGDWLLIRSTDLQYNDPTATRGVLRKIFSISGNSVTLDAALYENMTSNAKCVKMNIATGGSITGRGQIKHNDPASHNKTLISISYSYRPFIGEHILLGPGGGPGIQYNGTIEATSLASMIDLINDSANGHYGYGVTFGGPSRGGYVARGTARNIRHAFTTTNAQERIHDDFAIGSYGEPEDFYVGDGFTAIDSTSAGFDTHEPGRRGYLEVRSINCSIGAQDRSADTTWVVKEIENPDQYGIHVADESLRGKWMFVTVTNPSDSPVSGAAIIRFRTDFTLVSPSIPTLLPTGWSGIFGDADATVFSDGGGIISGSRGGGFSIKTSPIGLSGSYYKPSEQTDLRDAAGAAGIVSPTGSLSLSLGTGAISSGNIVSTSLVQARLLRAVATAASDVPARFDASTGQTANLLETRVNGSTKMSVDSSGKTYTNSLKVGVSSVVGQVLAASDTTGNVTFQNVTIPTKSDIGLGNVDNTSDISKPISTATQTALDTKVSSITGSSSAYIKNSVGLDSIVPFTASASPTTIVIRDSSGRASFGEPTSGSHATTKNYTDTEVAKKFQLTDGAIAGTPLYMSPESGRATTIPYYMNDLAYNNARGGATRIYVDGVLTPYATVDNLYTATSSAVNFAISTITEIVVEVDCHKIFKYGTKAGFAVNESWRAKKYKIEFYNLTSSSWVTVADVTGNTTGEVVYALPGNSAAGMDKLRFTFSDWAHASQFRIGNIFVLNYASPLGSALFLTRDGGDMYGNINMGDKKITSTTAPFASADLTNKAFVDASIATKQSTLVSGTNIKTVNGSSLLGSGDITISGGGSSNTFENGLTQTGSVVKLGGTLEEDISIEGGPASSLSINIKNNLMVEQSALRLTQSGAELTGGNDDVVNINIKDSSEVEKSTLKLTKNGAELIGGTQDSGFSNIGSYQGVAAIQVVDASEVEGFTIFRPTEIQSSPYPNSRDDTATTTPINFIYTDSEGNLRSAPTSSIGGSNPAYVSKSANYTLTASDHTVDFTATATATLPTAVGITGKRYEICNSFAGTLTVATTSSQTIYLIGGTATTKTLSQGESLTVVSTGTNWRTV